MAGRPKSAAPTHVQVYHYVSLQALAVPARTPLSTIRHSSRMGVAGKVALQDLQRAGRIARLRRERGFRDVRRHAVPRHRPPGMVRLLGLREPDVTRIAGQMPGFERPHLGLALYHIPRAGVDEIAAGMNPMDLKRGVDITATAVVMRGWGRSRRRRKGSPSGSGAADDPSTSPQKLTVRSAAAFQPIAENRTR